MAGKSNRFIKSGIKLPKFLLPLNGRSTVISEIFVSLSCANNPKEKKYKNSIKKILSMAICI